AAVPSGGGGPGSADRHHPLVHRALADGAAYGQGRRLDPALVQDPETGRFRIGSAPSGAFDDAFDGLLETRQPPLVAAVIGLVLAGVELFDHQIVLPED